MKLIVAGTRDLLVDSSLVDALVSFFRLEVKEVVSGGEGKVDEAGEEWSQLFLEKEPKVFHAEWMKHGLNAGRTRNTKMAKYADELLLIWDGKSKGSSHMKQEMMKAGKPVHEVILR